MQKINTVVVGGGQAGLAISEHLNNNNIPHIIFEKNRFCLLYTSPSPRDGLLSRMPSSA